MWKRSWFFTALAPWGTRSGAGRSGPCFANLGERKELMRGKPEQGRDESHEDPAIKDLCELMGFTLSQARDIWKRYREYPMEDELEDSDAAQPLAIH